MLREWRSQFVTQRLAEEVRLVRLSRDETALMTTLGDTTAPGPTNSGVFGAWNDARDTSICPAMYTWRQSVIDGSPTTKPAVDTDCPDDFGATSPYGGWYTP